VPLNYYDLYCCGQNNSITNERKRVTYNGRRCPLKCNGKIEENEKSETVGENTAKFMY
jgi:hypothetical protein